MIQLRNYLIGMLLLIVNDQLWAQDLAFQFEPDSVKNYFQKIPEPVSSLSLTDYLNEQVDSLRKAGFLAASVDSVVEKKNEVTIYAYLGERVNEFSLSNGNIDDSVYVRYQHSMYKSWKDVEVFKQELLNDYMGKGYINARIFLDEFTFTPSRINASVNVEKGSSYRLSSIVTEGDLTISTDFLYRYFDLEKGQLLTGDMLSSVQQRSEQSNLFQLTTPPQFYLKKDGEADLYLTLTEKRGNQFDLLIGLLPNPNPQLANQNLLVTGEGTLQLLNPFGGGRELSVDYKQLQPESPILRSAVYLPVLFGQKFGARASFNLEKQDSSFIKLNYEIGADYQFGGNKHLTIGYNATTSYLQRVDTSVVKETKELPPSSDYKLNLYKATYQNTTLNSVYAPTDGYSLMVDGGVGNRTIEANTSVLELNKTSDFDFAELYRSVNEEKLVLQANADFNYFFPFGKSSTILLKNQSGFKYFNNYFVNDLYRLGGINTIRGFDERSFLANAYTVNTAEYRLLLTRDSFFSVFTDVGYLKNDRIDSDDLLIGVGSGLDLSTRAGVFSVNLAIGRSEENPFDLNKTRIHFGYVNVF